MEKSSTLASELWPYLLPRIERLVQLGVGGGGGGSVISGAPTPHTLSSTHHSGILADSQGPQFLKIDGSRALAGHLAVDAGILIDGVDISAHVADPDAHHARVTTGNTGIALSGQQVSLFLNATASGLEISTGLRLADNIAGAGLAIASKVLAVGAGLGITVNADDVALTTPGTLTVATTNAAAGNHTHAVTASSDVGTTPAAALLKSTASGGIVLGSLTVKGSVDVISNGDFTVGNNVLFVDESLESVGINRAPDPQFDLDIAGNLRAVYIVGKHAIQLKNVLIISHFDGREPYETNFYGEPNGHFGQIGTGNEYAVYRRGLYYKALQIARATINYVPNPSFEVNVTDGWTYVQGGTGGSVARLTTNSWVGTSCAYLMASTTGYSAIINYSMVTIAGGESVTASYYVYDGGAATAVGIEIYTSGGVLKAFSNVTTAGDYDNWQRVTLTWLNTTGIAQQVGIAVNNRQNDGTTPVLIDGVQFEVQTFASPYFDGSVIIPSPTLSEAWNGTAHNSASTRQNAAFGYAAAGNLDVYKGTAMAWVYTTNAGDSKLILGHGVDASEYVLLRINGTTLEGVWGSISLSGGTVPVNTWTHVAMVWGLGSASLYVNGVLVDADTGVGATVLAASLAVGGYGSTQWLDGLIDDFCILDRTLAVGAILSIVESDAPVFAESSVFHFRTTPKGLVWADEEGLWMRDVTGEAVLGAYGGEAATKSWGGKNLAAGDILFGRYGESDGGWLYFDRDGVSSAPYLSLGYSDVTVLALDTGGASLNGVLDITTTGGIYQGTGTFASPTTGLKVWNDGGVGRIGGYNAGTAQWYANTDGRLYAGAGKVTLDANGLRLTPTIDWLEQTAVSWVSGSTVYGYVTDYQSSVMAGNILDVLASRPSYNNRVKLRSLSDAGYESSVDLYTQNASGGLGEIRLQTAGAYSSAYIIADLMYSPPIIRALSSAGLSWQDDGGNLGVFVADGGKVAIGGTDASAGLTIHSEMTGASGSSASIYGIKIASAMDATTLLLGVYPGGDYAVIDAMQVGVSWTNRPLVLQGAAGYVGVRCVPTVPFQVLGNAYFSNDVSALTFTDRTRGFEGDALSELAGVKAKGGEIDHSTLPAFAKSADGQGRDLGAMISLLTVAVQQLAARMDKVEAK